MSKHTLDACRHHAISMGHCVWGHMEEKVIGGLVVPQIETGKCYNPHGHNYEFIFHVTAKPKLNKVDDIGRVIDFGIIKTILCQWLEDNWDHKFMIYKEDTRLGGMLGSFDNMSIIQVDYNPTVENIAHDFLYNIAPELLKKTAVQLRKLTIYETSKCFCCLELTT